uniref:hypothetical protein n=1 Tax=Paractinoplanes polyasparticus TaxID=2856853 RepID=UPI001C85E40A|nr:hypothetical protein [Actinoplanes polyasparticus]
MTLVGRDEGRGASAAEEVGGRFLRVDLSVLSEVRALAALLAAEGAVDRLVANVGGMWVRPWTTADGIDGVFALNHLSPLVLTENLLGSLPAVSRVVAVTSSSIATIPWSRLSLLATDPGLEARSGLIVGAGGIQRRPLGGPAHPGPACGRGQSDRPDSGRRSALSGSTRHPVLRGAACYAAAA